MATKPVNDPKSITVSIGRNATIEVASNGFILELSGKTSVGPDGGDTYERSIANSLKEAFDIAKAYLESGTVPKRDMGAHPDQGLPPGSPGAPDNTLPQPGAPVDPGYGKPEGGHPDQGLPVAPARPDQGLPGSPGHPDNKPPVAPGRPDQGLPPTAQPKK